MTRTFVICALAAAMTALVGCGETEQTAKPATKKSDGKPWEASDSAFVAPGWKAGDQAAWDEQLRNRAQAQNEYAKVK